jgi:hypothetical protein
MDIQGGGGMMPADSVSGPEKETIQGEIRKIIDELIRGCESLDPDAAFRAFSGSPDFLMMGTDGSLADHAAYIKGNVEYLRNCSSFRLATKREEIRILGPATAVFAWSYAAEAVLKTGRRETFDGAGASFVFQKKDGGWKVVYYHESSSPPRQEEANGSD